MESFRNAHQIRIKMVLRKVRGSYQTESSKQKQAEKFNQEYQIEQNNQRRVAKCSNLWNLIQ